MIAYALAAAAIGFCLLLGALKTKRKKLPPEPRRRCLPVIPLHDEDDRDRLQKEEEPLEEEDWEEEEDEEDFMMFEEEGF